MAQMSVPAEPSYKSTSYSGLKGADFSNDPSLVAKNHSPDLLNMISDNGGSPIKRKGWEVTDTLPNSVQNIWHFQMYGTKWHIATCRNGTYNRTDIYEINSEGAKNLIGYVTGRGSLLGYFFHAPDETKTGFYILGSSGDIKIARPASTSATSLTLSTATPTVPVARELANYKGEGGVSNGINLLTRQAIFKYYDNREKTFTPRLYRVFPDNSPFTIHTIVSVKLLKEDGTWYTCTSEEFEIYNDRLVRVKRDHFTQSQIENVTEITVEITSEQGAKNALKICKSTCSTIYSQMTEGQVFVSGNPDYPQYVWYSDIADPLYFPDTNYLFVGGAGTDVKGMIPFGNQIAVFKEPSVTESTIFLINYTTATYQKIDTNGEQYTETRDVYQVKHGFAGIGSLSADTVLALGDEPLFLSQKGIMGMVASAINSTNSLKNRSGYLDPKLLKETNLSNAVATVHDNYYILVVNGHAYVLDARQKSSDYKGNTSYLYESYYWDNIPASCIASDGEILWFGTADGRLCRFKNSDRMDDYSDNTRYGDDPIRAYIKDGETEYSGTWLCDVNGDTIVPERTEKYILMGIRMVNEAGEAEIHRIPDGNTPAAYTVYSWDGTAYTDGYVVSPIRAVWSTPLDNDGATPYFKTMQKKGSGCTLYPFTRSSVDAYLQKDGNDEMYIGSMFIDVENWEDIDFTRFTFIADRAPRDVFFKKKMKKYIRLKIILKNEELDEAFGVQEIFKTYLHTRYAKGSTLVKRSDY